ncbi:Uncharacterised protein [Nocardia africana]|uniref:Uncharacterized protein n=1 Tax=Nocardia africana TaxID=134964 RepID=A0A378X1K3_9NOCA|nr:Uncharacterised protein [Nocardia africana]
MRNPIAPEAGVTRDAVSIGYAQWQSWTRTLLARVAPPTPAGDVAKVLPGTRELTPFFPYRHDS